jgi:hypothetical protein
LAHHIADEHRQYLQYLARKAAEKRADLERQRRINARDAKAGYAWRLAGTGRLPSRGTRRRRHGQPATIQPHRKPARTPNAAPQTG